MTTLIAHVERGLKPAQLHHSPAVERVTEFQEPQGPCKPVAAIGKEASTVRLTRLDCVNSQQAKTLLTAPTPNFEHSPFFGLQRVLPLNPQPCFSNIFLYWGIYKTGRSKLLALELFNDYNNRISARILSSTETEYLLS